MAASSAALDKRVGNEQIDKQSTLSSLLAVRTLASLYRESFLSLPVNPHPSQPAVTNVAECQPHLCPHMYPAA